MHDPIVSTLDGRRRQVDHEVRACNRAIPVVGAEARTAPDVTAAHDTAARRTAEGAGTTCDREALRDADDVCRIFKRCCACRLRTTAVSYSTPSTFWDVDGPNPFPEPVLNTLRRLIPCDVVTYHEHAAVYTTGEPAGAVTPAIRKAHEHWWDQSPLQPSRGAQMYSDYLTPGQFHRLELYHDVGRPLGVEDMIRLWICPDGTAGGARLEFDRPDGGFREHDRNALNIMLPHLKRFHRRAELRRARTPRPLADALTDRQTEILELVAEGRTNDEIAKLL
jgi:hypothetical protein